MENRAYCTMEDVQALGASAFKDYDLVKAISAATVRIEQETHRVFVPSDVEERTFDVTRGAPRGYCLLDDLLQLDSVSWEGTVLTTAEYRLEPGGRRVPKVAIHDKLGQWTQYDEIVVTGVWGYSWETPADIREICAEWVIRVCKWADAGFGDGTAMPEMGEIVYKKAIPEDIRRVLDRYRRVVPFT